MHGSRVGFRVMGVPHISTPVLRFFRWIARGYFRRHFSAVRVSEGARWAKLPDGPVIVFANHSSWWDPMVSVLLASRYMPERRHYAPMDAAALQRYPILKRVGVIWITPQGRFADARERPLEFKPGLAALACKLDGGCTVLPMAVEYTFWDERLPEVLMHFAEPIRVEGETADELEETLKAALLEAMETLKAKAIARDPAAFSVLLKGRAGVGGFYQLGQRAIARLRRRTYQPEHTAVAATTQDEQG